MRKRIVDIDWSPYLVRVEHLVRRATEALNNKEFEDAHYALLEIERNAWNCRTWIKENTDGR